MNTDTKTGEIFSEAAADAKEETPPHMIAMVNAIAVKIVFPFVAKNDIRFYLNGVNIRPLDDGGVMIAACDGTRLIVVRDPDGWVDREMIVSVHKDGLKHAAADGQFVVMSNGSAWFQDNVALPRFIQPGDSRVDGDFPRFEKVLDIEGFEEGIFGAVNPGFLRDALAIDAAPAPSIRFWTRRDDDSPLIFQVEQVAGLEAIGAIMKMRGVPSVLPAWLPRPGPFELTQEARLSAVMREQTKPARDKPLNTAGDEMRIE